MLASVTHILPVTTLRRQRLLPIPGRVTVRKGQKVSAADVVAEVKIAPEHMLLETARWLGVSQNKADASLHYRVGDVVGEGDVLAGPIGIARKVLRAPKTGAIVAAGGGQVLLQVASKPFELKAGLSGLVSELYDELGVEILTTGALIQGVWGNGRIDAGLMNVLMKSNHEVLSPDMLDVSQRGSIIFGGYCKDPNVITTAAEIPLRGIILSCMDSGLIPLAEKMPFPILVVEGFGDFPLTPAAFRLLSTNERREAALNAEPWDRLAGTRPEVVIPLPAPGNQPLPGEESTFTSGQKVRIVHAPQKGLSGVLVALRPGLVKLPNGIQTYAADVRLDGGETIMFPLVNLEVIE
jgi:hypothetical protein